MPTPSKFTKDRRERILQALQVGASLDTAAAVGGVGPTTLKRWIEEGRTAAEGSTSGKRAFYELVLEAQAHPKARALGIIYKAMEDKPELAWKFIERREHGFAPPAPMSPGGPSGPVVIQLSLSDGRPVLPATAIEVGALEQDQEPGAGRDPAPLATA